MVTNYTSANIFEILFLSTRFNYHRPLNIINQKTQHGRRTRMGKSTC
jgi:hypothetical protein